MRIVTDSASSLFLSVHLHKTISISEIGGFNQPSNTGPLAIIGIRLYGHCPISVLQFWRGALIGVRVNQCQCLLENETLFVCLLTEITPCWQTPHTASGISDVMAALRYDRQRAKIETPPPSLLGATKILNGIPNLSQYRDACKLVPGGSLKPLHPGRVLPGMVQTTQALFGVATCKAGTTQVLRTLADMVPDDAPRYYYKLHAESAETRTLISV